MNKDAYILVQWPDSQNFMEEPWFEEEAILALGCEDKVGSSAYFIPRDRVIINNESIRLEVYDLLSNYKITEEEKIASEKEWNSGIPFEGGMSFNEALVEAVKSINN